ncbi:MAG TPA: hypothetical protein VKG01_04675 [Thermoanaerobaculia bacterium]|nr:hypothetical protein [Thermoanaerobaculia bacterium]
MTQSYFVPELPVPSAVAVLAFLGTAFVLAALGIASIVAFAHGKRRLAGKAAITAACAAALYLGTLVAVSLASPERVLGRGDRKYFCEIDCHLAYSLEESARRAEGAAVPARTIATVRTWFDEKTIAPFRGDAPLTPNPRVVYALDDDGNRYPPSSLEETPLNRSLRPGESYTTTFVFDLPPGVRRPRLFLGDAPGIEIFVIGHESSLLHRKVYFGL